MRNTLLHEFKGGLYLKAMALKSVLIPLTNERTSDYPDCNNKSGIILEFLCLKIALLLEGFIIHLS